MCAAAGRGPGAGHSPRPGPKQGHHDLMSYPSITLFLTLLPPHLEVTLHEAAGEHGVEVGRGGGQHGAVSTHTHTRLHTLIAGIIVIIITIIIAIIIVIIIT